jgi:hypothetical protein
VTVAAATLLLAACGGSPAAGLASASPSAAAARTSPSPSFTGAATAQRIASDPSDVPGAKTCPASGTWPQFVAYLQGTDPSAYRGAQDGWNKLVAAGATDGYIAIHADDLSECGAIDHETQTQGRVVNIAAVRFKDETAAVDAYRGPDGPLGVDVAALQNLGASGQVDAGMSTGLGENSVVASTLVGGAPFYAAYWQRASSTSSSSASTRRARRVT